MIPRLNYENMAANQPFYAAFRRPDFAFPTHSHDFYEVFLCLEGSGVHECNGHSYSLSPGEMWFIHPDDVHSIRPKRDFVFINVAWPVLNWEKWCALAGFEVGKEARNVAAPELGALFHRVTRSFVAKVATPLEICHFWAKIAGVLTPPAPVETRPDWMLRGLRALESEEGIKAGWPLLLQSAHISPGHLCREWKKTFGVTPTQWINARRLENAAGLLLQSNLPIKEISARCGFENTTYFYRLFQERYGSAPKSYRRQPR
ncbi:xylose operon regulatory protein [Abditibacteriota bacterium]|nr:xylose operon regulatory protein [Abditibacteriota bacterium]